MLQDTFLFSGTIADDIRYGRPEATNDEVEAAAKAALVTEFADKLETGINTELADGGIGLSGGRCQRVGIARALLTDAPIVLLDEPTTGLDVHAEELVVQALTILVTNRTVIMTTHAPVHERRRGDYPSGSGPAHATATQTCPPGVHHRIGSSDHGSPHGPRPGPSAPGRYRLERQRRSTTSG